MKYSTNCPWTTHIGVYWRLLLTHWGRMTNICVSKLTIIGSDSGFAPARRQAIIWTNAGILLIGPLGTNFSEILVGIQTFYLRKMHLNMSSALYRLFRLGLNKLRYKISYQQIVKSLEAARYRYLLLRSLWHMTRMPVLLLSRSVFRAVHVRLSQYKIPSFNINTGVQEKMSDSLAN